MGWQDFGGYWAELGMGQDAPAITWSSWRGTTPVCSRTATCWAAAIYAAAASPGWESYEILGDDRVEPFLKQYLSVHPVRVTGYFSI